MILPNGIIKSNVFLNARNPEIHFFAGRSSLSLIFLGHSVNGIFKLNEFKAFKSFAISKDLNRISVFVD